MKVAFLLVRGRGDKILTVCREFRGVLYLGLPCIEGIDDLTIAELSSRLHKLIETLCYVHAQDKSENATVLFRRNGNWGECQERSEQQFLTFNRTIISFTRGHSNTTMLDLAQPNYYWKLDCTIDRALLSPPLLVPSQRFMQTVPS